MKIQVNRAEYRTHTFNIPDGLSEDEVQAILNDYDWHDSPIYAADEDQNELPQELST